MSGDLLLEGPRSVIEGALLEPDSLQAQERYDMAVRVVSVAHGFGIPRAEGARGEYLFVRPDLVHEWSRENGGKRPMLTDIATHADDWKPGVYTAEQVIEAATSERAAA